MTFLHELIVIGNDVYGDFMNVVNEGIERVHPNEITTHRKILLCEDAIKGKVAKRGGWEALSRVGG